MASVAAAAAATVENYEKISRLIKDYRTENFEKINVYGVLTYISHAPKLTQTHNYCTQVTIVDDSCSYDQRLKTIVFSSTEDLNSINGSCKIGDIIRFHRFRVQEYKGQPQGCANSIFTSWIRFKSDSTDFQFEGNRASRITDEDERIVTRLRNWLKTNPNNVALLEAALSIPASQLQVSADLSTDAVKMNSPNDLTLLNHSKSSKTTRTPPKTAAASVQVKKSEKLSALASKLLSLDLRLVQFDHLKQEGYFDVVCQLLAKCEHNGNKFILVWDGTRSNMSVLHESNFLLDKNYLDDDKNQEAMVDDDDDWASKRMDGFLFDSTHMNNNKENNATDNNTDNATMMMITEPPSAQFVYYSKSIEEMTYQVFVYDEYVTQIEKLQPGDFILLKNVNTKRPSNSDADTVIKMPGGVSGRSYKREVIKLASHTTDQLNELRLFKETILNQIESRVQQIREKAESYKLDFIIPEKFFDAINSHNNSSSINILRDETMENIILRNANLNLNKNLHPTSAATTSTATTTVKKNKVDKLLEDEESKYEEEDDEDDDEFTTPPKKTFTTEGMVTRLRKFISKSASSSPQVPLAGKGPRAAAVLNRSMDDNSIKMLSVVQLSPTILTSSAKKRIKDKLAINDCKITLTRIDAATANKTRRAAKKKKKEAAEIDPCEISEDIYALKRLIKLTYLVPALSASKLPSNTLTLKNQQIYFDSITDMTNRCEKYIFMRSKIIGKLFNYSMGTSPQLASVYVTCKKCSYVNFTPFHLALIHQSAQLTKMLDDLKSSSSSSSSQNQQNKSQQHSADSDEDDDDEDEEWKQSVNFSLDWLKTATPSDFMGDNNSNHDNQQQSSTMLYNCPRCAWLNKQQNQLQQTKSMQQSPSILDYVYRFWFVVRDQSGTLDPCLIESDAALKFLNNISPIAFYSSPSSGPNRRNQPSHHVYQTINEAFSKKYLFTIESFNLNLNKQKITAATAAAAAAAHNETNQQETRKLPILYKIVDMIEVVSK